MIPYFVLSFSETVASTDFRIQVGVLFITLELAFPLFNLVMHQLDYALRVVY